MAEQWTACAQTLDVRGNPLTVKSHGVLRSMRLAGCDVISDPMPDTSSEGT